MAAGSCLADRHRLRFPGRGAIFSFHCFKSIGNTAGCRLICSFVPSCRGAFQAGITLTDGRDLNSPSLIAHKDLKHSHDEYVEKVNRQRAKEQREADQAEFEKLKGRFISLTMTVGTIRLHTLDSVEYYDEGTRQHICVGSFGYYLKPDHRHFRWWSFSSVFPN